MNHRLLSIACSTDSAFRGKADVEWLARTFKSSPKPPTAGRLVSVRDAAFKALPVRMVAAIRHTRGTRDYEGAVRNAAWWLRRRAAAMRRLGRVYG